MNIFIIFFLVLTIVEQSDGQTCGHANVASNFGGSSTIPQNLCVPTLAYDQSSIWLVWNKPDNYSSVVDYNVYMNGKMVGSAKKNAAKYSPAAAYINNFYANDKAGFHAKITFHSFLATKLAPNTTYKFTVRSVDCKGVESADSTVLIVSTAPVYSKVVDITQFGAIADNTTVNTAAIQKAIRNCSRGSTSAYGCKVLIPAGGIFLTGPIFLASNMTMEVVKGAVLKANTNANEFSLNGIIQSMISNNGTSQNIRLTGKGTLDGSGWKLAETIEDELYNQLPVYAKGSADTVAELGHLAAKQVALAGGGSSGYSNRSPLVSFAKVTNLYTGDLMMVNPSKDTIKVSSNSVNIVLANTRLQTYNANNGDGIGISSSQNFLAFNNFFNTGDDCIATNAGQGAAGQASRKPVQYLWIFNNYFREGHGAFVVGSQTSAWIQDVLVEDNVLFQTDNGLRLKSTPATGGGARRLMFRDTAMLGVGIMQGMVAFNGRDFLINQTDLGGQYTQSPFIFTLAYTAGDSTILAASESAQFKDINVTRVSVDNGKPNQGGSFITVDGYDGRDSKLRFPETFQQNLTFIDVKFTNVAPANISQLMASTFINVTITNWGNSRSPWMIRNSNNLIFSNVKPAPDGF